MKRALATSVGMQRDLDEIRAAVRRAANLIRRLLAFSRRQILQPQILDHNAVLQRAQRLLGRVIGAHITLTMDLSARSRVSANPGQIEQVMIRLLSSRQGETDVRESICLHFVTGASLQGGRQTKNRLNQRDPQNP